MAPLVIEPKDDVTPGVMLDGQKAIFEIKGWSHPEDAIDFYTPVFDWLKKYSQTPSSGTNFHFKLQYFNTASARQILRIISIMEEISKKSKAKIYWHHDTEDTDMLASGKRFSKMSTVPFTFVSQ